MRQARAVVRSEDRAIYAVSPSANDEDAILTRALAIPFSRMRKAGDVLISPSAVKSYLTLNLASREHEVFSAVFLDAQNRVIDTEDLFRGRLTQTSVYPREVVKAALARNAAGVIFAHNHPSGVRGAS